MVDRPHTEKSDAELLMEIAKCVSLEDVAKSRAKPLRDELLKRQIETGETNLKHDGWVSTLKKESVSAAWVARAYGYPKEEIPAECFDEVMKPELNAEKAVRWLQDQGHEVATSYSLAVGRKKPKSLLKACKNA